MNTAVLVPLSSYNSDLTHPVPYDSFIQPYERALGTNDYSEVVDRNWAVDLWRIIGTVYVSAQVTNWSPSSGSFTPGIPDPVEVQFTVYFNSPPITTRRSQPNFAVQMRDELVNFGVPRIAFSDPHPNVFPHARSSITGNPVGGAAMRARVQVDLSISPFFALLSGNVFPVVTANVDVTADLVNPDFFLEEGSNISLDPIGGTFPFGSSPSISGGLLRIQDRSRGGIRSWGNVPLYYHVAVANPIDLIVCCDTRFLP